VVSQADVYFSSVARGVGSRCRRVVCGDALCGEQRALAAPAGMDGGGHPILECNGTLRGHDSGAYRGQDEISASGTGILFIAVSRHWIGVAGPAVVEHRVKCFPTPALGAACALVAMPFTNAGGTPCLRLISYKADEGVGHLLHEHAGAVPPRRRYWTAQRLLFCRVAV
jgi:hypothetical protein